MAARGAVSGGAIVLGGDHIGLGVVRSLGRRGVPVLVLDEARRLAAASRYTTSFRIWPQSGEAQVDFLLALADRIGGAERWVIFPTRDDAVALLARHSALLSQRYRLTVPAWETVRLAHDKAQTYRLAGELNIPFPATRRLSAVPELASLDLAFPVVVKPANSSATMRALNAKALLAGDARELAAACARLAGVLTPDEILLQELIPGGGEAQFSFAALCDDGLVVASVTAQRVRQLPRVFGHNSTFVQTVRNEPVEAAARRLLAAMRYTGLVEVEFKYDRREEIYKLLDVNTRPWGWHTLGARAGVDFCYLAWLQARDLPVPSRGSRIGVRWMREIADPFAAASELLSGDLSPSRYLASFARPIELAVLAWDDPLPAGFELRSLLSYAAGVTRQWNRYLL